MTKDLNRGEPANDALMDTGAIAAMLGVSRAHVTDRLTKQSTFPAPVIDLSQRLRRWDREQVMAWLGVRAAPRSEPVSRGNRPSAIAAGHGAR